MKTKATLLFSFLFLCFISVPNLFAQKAIVTPKKEIYKRPKTDLDSKRSFTVIRPVVKGLTPALNKKTETAIGYEKNFDFNIKDEINEAQWLSEASYAVDYNKNGILGVSLTVDGAGAYPSTYTKSVVVNLKNGERIKPQDVFTKLDALVALNKKAQREEIKKAILDIKKENPDEENPAALFENSNFTVENLNEFTVSDKGVTFLYDYGFPHVILALQPEGKYFFSWAQLKPFIKRDGLFGKFIR